MCIVFAPRKWNLDSRFLMNYVPDSKAQVLEFHKQTEISRISESEFPYGATCITCTAAIYNQSEKMSLKIVTHCNLLCDERF